LVTFLPDSTKFLILGKKFKLDIKYTEKRACFESACIKPNVLGLEHSLAEELTPGPAASGSNTFLEQCSTYRIESFKEPRVGQCGYIVDIYGTYRLPCLVSGHCKNALGRGSTSSRHITKLESTIL
jgi:hypothetical protein